MRCTTNKLGASEATGELRRRLLLGFDQVFLKLFLNCSQKCILLSTRLLESAEVSALACEAVSIVQVWSLHEQLFSDVKVMRIFHATLE